MLTSLVTGGAGFIGSHLVEALLAAGRRVVVLDDLSTGTLANLASVQSHPDLRLVLDSVTNEQRLDELLDEADEVYHLAAVVGVRLVLEEPQRTVATNIDSVEAVAASSESPAEAAVSGQHERGVRQEPQISIGGGRRSRFWLRPRAAAGSTRAARRSMNTSPWRSISARVCRS